jgi:hypothetical protein
MQRGNSIPERTLDWATRVLTPRQAQALDARFGLATPTDGGWARPASLGAIADAWGASREGVRRAVVRGLARLAGDAAYASMRHAAHVIITGAGGAITTERLREQHPEWPGFLRLMAALPDSGVYVVDDIFSLCTPREIACLRRAAWEVLKQDVGPMPLTRLVSRIRPHGMRADGWAALLEGHKDMGFTIDGRVFLFDAGWETFLLECAQSGPATFSHRQLTALSNARLRPRSQRGTATVLAALRRMPAVKAVAPGRFMVR